jgi:hypothetical protein
VKTHEVLDLVGNERVRQDELIRQGVNGRKADYRDGSGSTSTLLGWKFGDLAEGMRFFAKDSKACTWSAILLEEVFEAMAEDDPERLQKELVQVAAVAVAWIEALNQRGGRA